MQYYQMAIEKNNTKAMNQMSLYYQYTEKNYDQMLKYYLMSIDKGNVEAIHYLGLYYQKFF